MVQVRAANASVQERLRAAVDETNSVMGKTPRTRMISSTSGPPCSDSSTSCGFGARPRRRPAGARSRGQPDSLRRRCSWSPPSPSAGCWARCSWAIAGILGAALLVALALREARAGARPSVAAERAQLLARIGLEPDADDARVYRAAEELAAARARRQLARERAAAIDLRRSRACPPRARRGPDGSRRRGGRTELARLAERPFDADRPLPGSGTPAAGRGGRRPALGDRAGRASSVAGRGGARRRGLHRAGGCVPGVDRARGGRRSRSSHGAPRGRGRPARALAGRPSPGERAAGHHRARWPRDGRSPQERGGGGGSGCRRAPGRHRLP